MCIECTRSESPYGESDPSECIYEADEHHPKYINEVIDNRRQWPTDSAGKQFNPYAGSVTPSDGKCNASLERYEERYGERRYCSRPPIGDLGPPDVSYCYSHRERISPKMRAKNASLTGVHSKTLASLYEHLDAMKRVVLLASYDSLVGESQFDFEAQLQTHTIDFSDYDGPIPLELATEMDDNQLPIDIPVPTQKIDRCLHLYFAAADTISSLNVKERLFAEGHIDEQEITIDEYEDSDGNVEEVTMTKMEEHPANMVYSRLTRDKPDHLEYGGVTTDDSADVAIDMGDSQIITEVSPDDVDPSQHHPNHTTDETEEMPLHDPDLTEELE